MERRVTGALEDVMESRRIYTSAGEQKGERLTALEGIERAVSIAAPIISAGDVTGAVVFLGDGDMAEASPSDIKLATVAASFLGKNMEDF